MRFTAGTKLGRYVIEALLGEGGMGEVYRAHDTVLHRKIALKLLRRDPEANPETWGNAVARMLREARAVAALNHPNTVAVYDIGEEDGAPFIAMELIEGESLRKRVGADVPLGERVRYLVDVAHALEAAHQRGLVHRDIKPENVMLRRDGVIKVLDFGIARRISLGDVATATTIEGGLSTLSGEGRIIGTPAYMAPEQVRGEEVDARSDQFSWGIVAYELLSGRLPFGDASNPVRLIAAILSQEPPPLEGIPEEIEEIVLRALSKNANDRFASMDELIAELSPFAMLESSASHSTDRSGAPSARSSRRTPSKRRARKKARARWALGAFALAAAIGVTALTLRRVEAPTPAPSATPAVASSSSILDLPLPSTSNPEALAVYRQGLQAVHDAAWPMAAAAFKRAVELDPSLGSAHLRMAIIDESEDRTDARASFRKAILLRASMPERDQTLLDALEPHMYREPPDRAEAIRRFDAASERYPRDVEIFFWKISLKTSDGDSDEYMRNLDRCLAIDPHYIDCLQAKGRLLHREGRIDDALAVFDRCIASSPIAIDCFFDRARVFNRLGECRRSEDEIRKWLNVEPDSGLAYSMLAQNYLADRRPDALVREAIEQADKRFSASGRSARGALLRIQYAIAIGDFVDAERRICELEAALGEGSTTKERTHAISLRVRLLEEMGRTREAGEAARAYLRRSAALPKSAHSVVYKDPTVLLWDVARRADLASSDEFESARAAWLREIDLRGDEKLHASKWLAAYAAPATSIEDAAKALALRPEIPFGHFAGGLSDLVYAEALVGKVHVLAGRPKEAIPFLEIAAGACDVLDDALLHVYVHHHLGLAREALGDKAGACKAYGVVLDRWGNANASITAKAARERRRSLGC